MPDWFVTSINIGYAILAYYILRKINFRKIVPLGSVTSALTHLLLASIFVVIGAFLFDIPIGFMGMNNPETTQALKEKWWGLPGISLSFLLFSLSFKNSFEAFRIACFTGKEIKKLSIGSVLFGAAFTILFLIFWVDADDVEPWAGPFILKYWWAVWFGLAFLHLSASMAIQGIRSALYADNT